MIAGLARFVGLLREAGISASPAEALDALRAVEQVGVADRARFRVALCSTLVKRADQRQRFDELFARFFVGPSGGAPGRAGERMVSGMAGKGARQRRAPEPVPAAPTRPGPPPPQPAGRSGERARADDAPQLARSLAGAREGGPERRGRLRRVVLASRTEAERVASERRVPAAADSALHRRFDRPLTLDDEREIARAVPRIVEQIRLRSERRLMRARRGRLHLRTIFRENARYGGVPWVLPRRRARRRSSRVVVLADVSWSTARAAGLFLAIAHEFLERAADTRVLVFVDRPIDATAAIAHWMRRGAGLRPHVATDGGAERGPGAGLVRGGVSFAEVLRALPGLNREAPSDYGRAFHALLRAPAAAAGRRTVLVILGDGRTNRFDPQLWAFEEVAARVGAVLWLVPEAASRWGTADSALGLYLAHVDSVVEARDLTGLARGVGELLRQL